MANNPIFSTFKTRDIGLQLLQPPPFTIYQGNGSFTVNIVNKYNTPITWTWSYNGTPNTLPNGYTVDNTQTNNTKITFNVSINTRENITDTFQLTATAGKYNAAETVQVTGNIYQVQTSSFIDLTASTSGGDLIVSYITATTIDNSGNLFVVGVISNDSDSYNIGDYGRGNPYNFGTLCNLNYSGITEVQLQSESTTAGFICAYDQHGNLMGYSTIAMTLPITQSLAITPNYQNLMTAVAVDNVNGYLYVSCSFQDNVNLYTIDTYPLLEKDYTNIYPTISNGDLVTAGIIKFIKLSNPFTSTYGVFDFNAMNTNGDESYGMSLAVDKGGDVYFTGYFGTNLNGLVEYLQSCFYLFTPAFGRESQTRLSMLTLGTGIFLFHYDSDGFLINLTNIDYALYDASQVLFGNYLTLDENGNIYITGVCDDNVNYLNLYIGEQPFVPSFMGDPSVYLPTGNPGTSMPGAYMIKYMPNLITVIEYKYFYPAHAYYYTGISGIRYDPVSKKNYILGGIYHNDPITFELIYIESYTFDSINGDYNSWGIFLPFPNTEFTTVLLKFDLNGNNEGYSYIDSQNYNDGGIIARSLNTDLSGNVYIAGNYIFDVMYNPLYPINIYSITPSQETAVQPFPPDLNGSNVYYVIKYNSSGIYQGASYTYQNTDNAPYCLPFLYTNSQNTLTCSSIDTSNNIIVFGNFGSNINTLYTVSPITTNTLNPPLTVPLLDSSTIPSSCNYYPPPFYYTIVSTESKLIEYSPYCGAVSNISLSQQPNKHALSWMPGKNDVSYQIVKDTFAHNEFPQLPFFVQPLSYAEAIGFSGNGKVALVGAPRYNSGDGKVYGYTNINNSWIFNENIPYNNGLNGYISKYGCAISLNYDGTRAIVGGSNWNEGSGYANILYLDQINDYEILTIPSTYFSSYTSPYFGNAVAMSGDGTRAIIGGFNASTLDPYYINGVVAIYSYYSYSGLFNLWTYPYILDPTNPYLYLSSEVFNPTINNYFGSSVALNYDGSVAIIGAPGDQYATTGSVIVLPDLPPSNPFICVLTINTLQIPAYFNYTSPPFTNLGTSVALSYDGKRAIASALSYSNLAPSYAVIYDLTNTHDINMSSRYLPYDVQLPYNSNLLIPSMCNVNLNNLSIDSAMNTVVFNGYQYNLQTSTQIYCPDNMFTPPYTPLFGNAVAMSYDGLTTAVSSPNYHNGDGSVGIYKYDQPNAQWNLYGQVYTSNVNTAGNFGKAVALSGDGNILLISEPNNDICYIYNLHSESGIGPYPPIAMTSNITAFISEIYGNGIYIATASSISTGNAYNVFDTDPTTSWNSSADSTYDSGGGVSAQTIFIYPWNPTSPVTVYGEWVQLQLPEAILLVSYTIRAPSTMTDYSTMPTGCYLLGSTDGSTWDYMRGDELEWSSSITSQTFNVNSDGSLYTYFRLLINSINPAGNFATIGKLILNASDIPYIIIREIDCPLYSYGTHSFGSTSLALNYDGTKALIGVSEAGENKKGEVVYLSINTSPLRYTLLASPLMYYTSAYTPDNSYFGFALALSYDGNTALISAPNYKQGPANANYYGYVARYSYNPNILQWSSPKIVPIDKTLKTLDNYFGISLAMNSNASKIVISTLKLNQNNLYSTTGLASVYTYSNNTWSSPTFINKTDMYTINSSNYAFYGTSLGMSADGNTVISTGFSFYLINKYSPDTNSWTNIARGEYYNVYAPEYPPFEVFGSLTQLNLGGPMAVLSGNATAACVGLSSFDGYGGQIYLYDLTPISMRPITSTQGDIKTTALSADGSQILCGIPSMKTDTLFGIANIQPTIVNTDIPCATISSPNVYTQIEPDPSLVYNSQANYINNANPGFGNAHAISADGKTAVVSAANCGLGYVAVYRKMNDVWTLNLNDIFDPNDPINPNLGYETPNALPTYDYITGGDFGFSVDISGDGSTIIIGDPFIYNATLDFTSGYTVIFKSSQNLDGTYSWSQGYELLGIDTSTTFTNNQYYGMKVVLNYDGNIAVVSAPYWLDSSDNNTGFVTIYNWSSGINNYIINNIIFGKNIISNYPSILGTFMGIPWFGLSISVSANGLTVAIGMPYINNSDFPYSNGYVYLWYSGLDSEYAILIDSPPITTNVYANRLEFGYTVKLSADGYTLAVGSRNYNDENGTTYVYRLNTPDFINNTINTAGYLVNNSIPFQITDGIRIGGGYCTLSGDGNTIVSYDGYGGGDYNDWYRSDVVVYKYDILQNMWNNIASIPIPYQNNYPPLFIPRASLSINNDGSIVFIGADFLQNNGYIILCSFDKNQNYIIKPLDANGNEGSSINTAQQNISSIQSSWNIDRIYDGSGLQVTEITNQNHTATGINTSYYYQNIPLIYNTYPMYYGKYYYSLTASNIPTSLYSNYSGTSLFIGIADTNMPLQISGHTAHIFGIADDTSLYTYSEWPTPYINFVNSQLWSYLEGGYQNSELFKSNDTIDIAIDTSDEIEGAYYIWYRINNNLWNFNSNADPSITTGGLPIDYLGSPPFYLTGYVYNDVGLTINSVSKNSVPQGFQFIG